MLWKSPFFDGFWHPMPKDGQFFTCIGGPPYMALEGGPKGGRFQDFGRKTWKLLPGDLTPSWGPWRLWNKAHRHPQMPSAFDRWYTMILHLIFLHFSFLCFGMSWVVDIWQVFGILLFELVCGCRPCGDEVKDQHVRNIMNTSQQFA